ncbi:MAG: flagellar assembly protein FliW [Planctomycetes bacterium]|nr:flagellar assembly protein FliW [Planctomycetota bacterium]
MKISTTRFGEIEITTEDIYGFPDGILGFPEVKQYVILDNSNGGPFRWLQALDVPSLAFVVIDPLLFHPDYKVEVKKEDIASIEIGDVEDGFVLVILTVPGENPADITANLLGPLIFNSRKMLAKQIVLTGSNYETKHRVFKERSTDKKLNS